MNKAEAFARAVKEKKRQFALGRFRGMKDASTIVMDAAVKFFKADCDAETRVLRSVKSEIDRKADLIELP